MNSNDYAPHNGIPNGFNEHVAMNGGRYSHRQRVLTVDEALPLTPFTSIVPFNSDVVPLPSVGLRSSVPLYTTPAARENGKEALEALNRDAVDPRGTSRRLQQTLDDLKELLKQDGMTKFTFNTAPKLSSGPLSTESPKPSLSPFAQRVLNQSSVAYTYTSPRQTTPRVHSNDGQQNSRTPNPSRPPQFQSQRSSINHEAYNDNSSVHVQIPKQISKVKREQNSTPYRPTPASGAVNTSSNIQIVIPRLPNDFPRADYTPSKKSEKPKVKSINQTQSRPPTQSHPAILPPIQTPSTPSQSAIKRINQPPSQTPSQPYYPVNSPAVTSSISVEIPILFAAKPQNQVQPPPQTPRQIAPQASQSVPPSVLNPSLAVVIPDLPATFNPRDYEVVPDSPDTPQPLSRKRKRSEIDGDEDGISVSIDEREKADASFRNLRDYLQQIFEAEDHLQPDATISNHFFYSTSDGISLTSAAQSKVENLLQKIITMGRFAQAPLDQLLRLQKLSDAALREAESIDVKVDDSMGESEVESWLSRLSDAETGLRAARTSLRLMLGGREDKQLYSEDVIQSALNVFKNVMNNCIVPIAEMRCSGGSASTFKLISAHKKAIIEIVAQSRRVLVLLAAIVGKVELSETVINTLEFTASRLIFVENAPFERDSVFGVAKFDSLRVVAMDALAQIFLHHPEQRSGIFDEILTSLEKLPVTKQSARHFKLAEGGSIQLVSALIMRLTQTSSSRLDDSKEKRRNKALEALNAEEDIGSKVNGNDTSSNVFSIFSESRAEQQPATAITELAGFVAPLTESARSNATYVVNFIVSRAMKSTKSGDAPYRNLLDLFVEDFITCLNSTDWPAAELLLRLFLFKMVMLAEGEKTPAPAKNMALDLLGTMGAAISELTSHVRKTAKTLEPVNHLAEYLKELAESSLDKSVSPADLVAWAYGPFRVTLEFLDDRASTDPQLHSAIGFFMASWVDKVVDTYDSINDDDEDCKQVEEEYGRLAYRLKMMITDRRWLSTEYHFDAISPSHARLAYSITLLNSQFCQSFGRVLHLLLGSMTSEQATVRSKSLKSVNQVLDTDPKILDTEPAVKHLILRCSNDISVQVRDSALTLVGKCISLQPALEEELMHNILARVNDTGIGVRKRAMKLAKEIYLRNHDREVRSTIAGQLLHRVTDLDEGVQELARQSIEEMWMSPFYQSTKDDDSSARFKLAMSDHVALMVKTVQRGNGVAAVLDKVLQTMLGNDYKSSSANFRVCKALVATMFETIIDNAAEEGNDTPSARDALQVLMIFAKADAKLFSPEQIQLLQPYIANVGTSDDLAVFRSVVVIFRHVLPHLSKVHNNFLIAVRKVLIITVTRMAKPILDDLIACLWIISSVLEDISNLTSMVQSTMLSIEKLKRVNLNDPAKADFVRKLNRLLMITGICGKHCDFDPRIEEFKEKFPAWKGDSVSKLMTDTFAHFASPSQPLEVRQAALEAIGMVCQSWPKNFSSANIYTLFQGVFGEKEKALEGIILRAFKDFLLLEEKRSEAGNEGLPGAAADPNAKLAIMGGGQGDGIAIGIAQRFLGDIIRLSLASHEDQALLATEVVASIARQGLVHPKECGPALIALETSPNPKISDIAYREHKALHEKHETILEKEYMRAVQLAYNYQRDVVDDTHGVTLNPFTSKLHLMVDVMKISKVKNRKKFFETLCSRIDFEPNKIDKKDVPNHLQFSQFIIENMAFFDYATVDELLSTVNGMEKVVAATGTGIAHAIETEIFLIGLDQPTRLDENGQPLPSLQPDIDQERLIMFTAASMMLSGLWGARTFLRRLYGLNAKKSDGKGKAAPKDLNRAPVKVAFVTGDKFWEENGTIMASLDSEESMMKQCRAFVELLSIDEDFKLAADGDEEAERARPSTPSEDEDDGSTPGPPSSSGRSRKRKAAGTPSGRKKRARSSSIQRSHGRAKGSKSRTSAEKSDNEEEW